MEMDGTEMDRTLDTINPNSANKILPFTTLFSFAYSLKMKTIILHFLPMHHTATQR
jgi:hypothetical protein